MKNIKYLPKTLTSISFILLLISFLLLFLGRHEAILRPNFILIYLPEFYWHVSNLSISYILFSSIGYLWLIMGVKTSNIIMLGSLILLANFIYELWIPILNTRDIIDAYYGSFGTIVAFFFLIIAKIFGLKSKEQSEIISLTNNFV